MKLINGLLATIVLASSLPAFAHQANVSLVSDGAGSWVAEFDARTINWNNANSFLDGDADTITFTGVAPGSYTVSLVGFEGGTSSDPIQFSSIKLNGASVDLYKKAFVLDSFSTSTPFTLSLTGTKSKADSYYMGAFQVASVPEPETYAMLLAGLGIMGAAARRRAKQA